MLAYLACQPAMRAERAALADLLWSDRSEEQSRASLRQELSNLRKVLPEDVVLADRQAVWLLPGAVSVDDTGPGEFLQGYDLRSEGFEDWLRSERSGRVDGPRSAAGARETRPSVAVLAFDDFGGGSDVFADGIVEEITGVLSRMGEVDVIARQSSFALRGSGLPVPEIAARLGCGYVVEGSVRRAGERVRVSVQLARGSDGHTLWADRFDDRIDDLFELQDRIAEQVAGRISPNLRAAEIRRAGSLPPADRTAYELVLTAYPHFWALKADDNRRAGELLDEAIARDPEAVQARALRAWVHAQQTTYMWSADPARDRARALALAAEAAERAEDNVPTLVAAAGAYSQAGDDQALARTLIRRVLDLDRNNAWAWIRQGWLHQYVGEVDDALAAFDRAERLSPLDPFLHQITFGRAATVYRWTDDPSEGLAMIEEGLRRHPGVLWPLRMVAVAHVRLGNLPAARAAAARLMEALPHLTIRYLRASLPPIAVHFDDGYYRSLALAGIPEG